MNTEKSLKILMLEDSADDINMIERSLKKNKMLFTAYHVDTREEFISALRTFEPDVILSDHGLPRFNSREALKISLSERSGAPFIIVTGTMTDEFAISCLQEGADDYILKSNLARLPLAIHRAVKEKRLERLKREARHALRKQNKELIKVNSELDQFVYSVSHNLRGPVASVLGLIAISKLEHEPERIQPALSMMETSMKSLDVTLTEITDFLRNARTESKFEVIGWTTLFENAFKPLSKFGYANDARINFNLESDIQFVTDERRLRAALINVLTNAYLFRSQARELALEISVVTSRDSAVIRISDNGIGINASALPKVLDMFYRGSGVSKGAGLGLYITREVVQKLGGEITVESEESKGTTVTIVVPNQLPG